VKKLEDEFKEAKEELARELATKDYKIFKLQGLNQTLVKEVKSLIEERERCHRG
jgi:hypothetical protein